jgi:hypothetical protein
LPDNHPSCFPHGKVTYDYQLRGELKPIEGSALLDLLADVPSLSGRSPFHVFSKQSLRPAVDETGEIECWVGRPSEERVFPDAPHADYWRASPQGSCLLLRGYQEDGEESQEPGTFLDLALPLWRAADVLEHALHLAERFPGRVARIALHISWDGLAGRSLISWSRPTAMHALRTEHRARVPSVTNAVTLDAGEGHAPAHLYDLLLPLYAAFDFDLRAEDVSHELARRDARSGEVPRAR